MRSRDIALVGVFSALSFGLMFLEIPILPFVNFLKYDPSEISALLLALNTGILQGVLVVLVKDILFYFARSGDIIGIGMNMLAGTLFIFLAVRFWRRKIVSASSSVGVTSIAMTILNAGVIPVYFVVMKWGSALQGFEFFLKVWWGILAFNLIKFSIDYVLTVLINKRVKGIFSGNLESKGGMKNG